MSLAVHRDGPRTAPAVVFLHAIATSAELWRPQVAALAQRFDVIRIDLPGHGGSPALGAGAGFPGYADAVVDTLLAQGVERFSLVGMSFGAMVAMQVASRHPARTERLVLACCAAKTPPPVGAMWHDRIAAVREHGIASQVEPSLERWFTPDFAAASPLTLDWVRGMVRGTPDSGFIAAAEIIADLDHLALLPALALPCLVLAGQHDQAASADMMRGLAGAIPQARFETVAAAHLANVEAPVEFTETVARFLAGS